MRITIYDSLNIACADKLITADSKQADVASSLGKTVIII